MRSINRSLYPPDNVAYYLFWTYQYFKRNKGYIEAWDTVQADDRTGAASLDRIDQARRLLEKFRNIDPRQDLYGNISTTSNGKPWITDRINGTSYLVDGKELSSGAILDVLFTIRRAQERSRFKDVKVTYRAGQLKILHSFKMPGKSAQDKSKGIFFDGESLVVSNFLSCDIDELCKEMKFLHSINNDNIEPVWPNVAVNKPKQHSHLPRGIGLWLWDQYQETGNRSAAVERFLGVKGFLDCMPKSSTEKNRTNLFAKLKKTDECIQQMEVLPMS